MLSIPKEEVHNKTLIKKEEKLLDIKDSISEKLSKADSQQIEGDQDSESSFKSVCNLNDDNQTV